MRKVFNCPTCGTPKTDETTDRRSKGSHRFAAYCRACEKVNMIYRHLKSRHGITKEQWHTMYAEQDGKCAICHLPSKLMLDHCHTTNTIRGLLCHQCNLGLGHFKDNQELLQAAISYLQKQGH